jgi:hypothetical protein
MDTLAGSRCSTGPHKECVRMGEASLAAEMHSSAARFAQSALQTFLEGDSTVFLLHAATALELLAKAYLASTHGSLIAANDFDSLLHACGESKHARTPRSRMRTIRGQEALERAARLIPALANLKASLQLLIWIRNGVVHAGQVESDAEASVLVPFLRACDYLLAATPQGDRANFWDTSIEMVDARLSESTDAAKVRVADAIATARNVFKERYASMEQSAQEAVLASIEFTYEPERYEETLFECPACSRRALLHGSYEVQWEPDWDYSDGQAWIAGAYPEVEFTPGALECRVCNLTLHGEEELVVAGVPSAWALEDSEAIRPTSTNVSPSGSSERLPERRLIAVPADGEGHTRQRCASLALGHIRVRRLWELGQEAMNHRPHGFSNLLEFGRGNTHVAEASFRHHLTREGEVLRRLRVPPPHDPKPRSPVLQLALRSEPPALNWRRSTALRVVYQPVQRGRRVVAHHAERRVYDLMLVDVREVGENGERMARRFLATTEGLRALDHRPVPRAQAGDAPIGHRLELLFRLGRNRELRGVVRRLAIEQRHLPRQVVEGGAEVVQAVAEDHAQPKRRLLPDLEPLDPFPPIGVKATE